MSDKLNALPPRYITDMKDLYKSFTHPFIVTRQI